MKGEAPCDDAGRDPVRPAGSGSAWGLAPAARGPADEALLAAVAERVVRRGLGSAAVFFLESVKPMSFLGSQALVFFEPFIRAFLTTERYQRFAALLENRDNLEILIRKIEDSEESQRLAERADKDTRKAEKAAARQRRAENGSGIPDPEGPASLPRGWWSRLIGRYQSRTDR